MDDLPDDFRSRLRHRIAYGEAARLAENARFDHAYGRDAAARIGGHVEAIGRAVMRRMGPEIDPELVELAVEDAIGGRKPRR